MKMTKAQLENALRNTYLNLIKDALTAEETDALSVGASEIAVPCLDAEGNEAWVVVKVSVPRGTRNGEGGYDPYDGYAVAEDYALTLEDRKQKKEAAEAKKQAKIAKDQAKRAEKKALAEANKGLKELRKIKLSPKKEETEDEGPQYLDHEVTV